MTSRTKSLDDVRKSNAKTCNSQPPRLQPPPPPTVTESCRVVRCVVDEVVLYEVKESELETLEKGNNADLYLNFAIFSFSTALTCIASLFTSTFDSNTSETIFICISIIGILAGAVLTTLWIINRNSIKYIIKKIRARTERR